MNAFSRTAKLLLIASALALGLTLGPNPAPALAAGVTVWVDDTPANNGSVRCPLTENETLQEGVVATGGVKTNVTINICPGQYDIGAQIDFVGYTNLKIIGNAKLTPVLLPGSGFAGPVLNIEDSTKVLVKGLAFDGQGHIGGFVSEAILFANTSGTIDSNIIARFHQPYTGADLITLIAGIAVDASDPQKVVINRNTIYDAQDCGIYVTGAAVAKITRNRVTSSAALTPARLEPQDILAGIALAQAASGSAISGNQIFSTSNLYPGSQYEYSRGILLYETSGTTVKGNVVSGARRQISIESYCENSSYPNANGNIISGNKLYDTSFSGVYIHADQLGSCAPHADGNLVKGNKIYSGGLVSGDSMSVEIEAVSPATAAGNVITGNTLAGFLWKGAHEAGTGVSGTVVSSNNEPPAPPAGAFSY